MRFSLLTIIFFLIFIPARAQNGDEIIGIWRHPEGKLLVRIDRVGDRYQGRITWLEQTLDANGDPMLDTRNPDPRLRKIPLKGNRILQGLKYDPSKNIWENGRYYVFTEGKTYPCQIVLLDENKIKISKLTSQNIPLKNEIWSRHQ